MQLLDYAPHDFIIVNHQKKDVKRLDGFVHRTFNSIDLQQFINSLQHIYKEHGGLENALKIRDKTDTYQTAIHHFKNIFFEIAHPKEHKNIFPIH